MNLKIEKSSVPLPDFNKRKIRNILQSCAESENLLSDNIGEKLRGIDDEVDIDDTEILPLYSLSLSSSSSPTFSNVCVGDECLSFTKIQFMNELRAHNFLWHDYGGKGDCFFIHLKKALNDAVDRDTLRAMYVEELAEYPFAEVLFGGEIESDDSDDDDDDDKDRDKLRKIRAEQRIKRKAEFDSHVKAMKLQHTYATHVEVEMMLHVLRGSERLRRGIFVISAFRNSGICINTDEFNEIGEDTIVRCSKTSSEVLQHQKPINFSKSQAMEASIVKESRTAFTPPRQNVAPSTSSSVGLPEEFTDIPGGKSAVNTPVSAHRVGCQTAVPSSAPAKSQGSADVHEQSSFLAKFMAAYNEVPQIVVAVAFAVISAGVAVAVIIVAVMVWRKSRQLQERISWIEQYRLRNDTGDEEKFP